MTIHARTCLWGPHNLHNTSSQTLTHIARDKHDGGAGSEATVVSDRAYVCECMYMRLYVTHTHTHFAASEHQHTAPQREKGEVVVPTELKGLWPPCQHDLFSTLGPPSLAASPFPSLSLASPPTRVYFCQLPYSCLHSVFARTHKTFLVRAERRCRRLWGTLVRW